MKNNCYLVLSIVPVLTFACVLPGCREVDPPLSNYADLGENGQPLLPTVPAVRDGRVKGGTAEWKAFEAPSEKGKKPATKGEEPEDEADSDEKIIADVQATIDEYNEVVGEKKYDELVDFFVEGQRENAGVVVTLVKDVDKILADMKATLLEKWPDGKDRIEKVFQTLGKNSGVKLMVTDLKVVSSTEVDGKLPEIPMMPTTVKFKLLRDKEAEKDYWFIEDAMLAEFDKYKPMIEAQKTVMAQMLEQVKGGAMPAEPIVQQLEMSAKAIEAMEALAVKPKDNAGDKAPDEEKPAEAEKKPEGGE